ncbi:MAG: protoheme IX farnesyltransferase [Akkermansiaceae bacterium]|nr:protoheme IX farnesyltransferase [Akkermansiaceae bacterium]
MVAAVSAPANADAPTLRADLATLVKARLNTFVLITAFFGFFVAVRSAGGWEGRHWLLLVHTLVGTAAAAFGASVFNQLMEIREDARMGRTSDRPLPARRVLPLPAFLLGVGLAAFGLIHLAAMVDKVAALLAAITIATYVFLYTPLKRRSAANTLVGAIPGALPPLIGWVAGGGAWQDPRGWYLFALLFLWQLPHFVSINWLCREQYEEAGFVMWSDGDVSGKRSARLAAGFSVGLAALGAAAPLAGFTGWIFGAGAGVAGLGLAAMAMRFAASGERPAFRRFFLMTLLYLPVVLTALAVDWK